LVDLHFYYFSGVRNKTKTRARPDVFLSLAPVFLRIFFIAKQDSLGNVLDAPDCLF
jgi:hypothetical protein